MYKIGITGSIGTGKTSIAKTFSFFNIPIFDADKEIKKILETEKITEELKKIWPEVIKENHIDKPKLKSIIFFNEREKKKLEKLLHPYLDVEKKRFEDANHKKEILVYDIPLIYETKSEKNFDLIILANCHPELQKKRVLNRDKISNMLYEKIISSQLSFKEKKGFNPNVINTDNPKLIMFFQVTLLLIKILIIVRLEK